MNRPQKQSMAELKLRRVTEHIQRLRDDLARPRVRVSEAAQSLIRYTRTTKDPLVCPLFLFLSARATLFRRFPRSVGHSSTRFSLLLLLRYLYHRPIYPRSTTLTRPFYFSASLAARNLGSIGQVRRPVLPAAN